MPSDSALLTPGLITSIPSVLLQSPLFLLFLDCVWQLMNQYPSAFQFTETYLALLSDSMWVPVFSTFLFNGPKHHADTMRVRTRAACGSPSGIAPPVSISCVDVTAFLFWVEASGLCNDVKVEFSCF